MRDLSIIVAFSRDHSIIVVPRKHLAWVADANSGKETGNDCDSHLIKGLRASEVLEII